MLYFKHFHEAPKTLVFIHEYQKHSRDASQINLCFDTISRPIVRPLFTHDYRISTVIDIDTFSLYGIVHYISMTDMLLHTIGLKLTRDNQV